MAAINTYPNASLPLTGSEAMIGTQAGATVQITAAGLAAMVGAATQSASASPTAPTSTSAFTMQGLAATVTPIKTGNVLVVITGTVVSPTGTAAGNGVKVQLSYGTGTAPTNGAALTGTQTGAVVQYTNPTTVTAADVHIPFSATAVLTGLTLGVAYWLDLAAEAVATVSSMGVATLSTTAVEL